MVTIINYSDEDFERQFVPIVEAAYNMATSLLENLPKSIDIKFTDKGASPDTGVGGFAVSKSQINFAIDKNFSNKELQKKHLTGVVLHEAFHVHQGFTNDRAPFTAIDSAIYEGCAIAFEREYADMNVLYANHSQYTDVQLNHWFQEIRQLGTDYFSDSEVYQDWAYYHPKYQQKWIIYSVGSWLVDRILKENNLSILDLKNLTPSQILKFSNVPSSEMDK